MMEVVKEQIPPFERFYLAHRDEVLGYLRRLLGQRAEDAWQETFLRALRAYDRLEHGRHLRAWVFTIATNVAFDELRGKPEPAFDGRAGDRAAARRVSRARAPDGRPAAEGTGRRRAAVRLRPPLRRDRRRPRLVRGSGACSGVVRRPQTERGPHDCHSRPRRPLPRRCAGRGASSMPATTSSTRRSASCSSPPPTAASAGSRTASRLPRTSSRGSSALRVLRSPLDNVRRELDEYFEGRRQALRPHARPARRAVPRAGAARARARPVRPHRDLRRRSRRRSGTRAPPAPSAP